MLPVTSSFRRMSAGQRGRGALYQAELMTEVYLLMRKDGVKNERQTRSWD